MPDKIGVAILGAGSFVHDHYLPILLASPSATLKAVFSRSQRSATALVSAASTPFATYFDDPPNHLHSLDALLERSDIAAVLVALPINVSPGIIRRALAAGKHVLSEKPVAPDLTGAADLIRAYRAPRAASTSAPADACVWAVAENMRYCDAFVEAGEHVAMLGPVENVAVTCHTYVPPPPDEDGDTDSGDWRRRPAYQGGYLLDGGVHHAAALRTVLRLTRVRVARVAALASRTKAHLEPADTMNGLLGLSNGGHGVYSSAFGTAGREEFAVWVGCTGGCVTAEPGRLRVRKAGATEDEVDKRFADWDSESVKKEVDAFLRSIVDGKADAQQTPEEAWEDLALVRVSPLDVQDC